ncbi:hypothetical protein [Streptomyces kebangsaanensis]|uniref:hypothetical protein n=1 Tax=Streptomyces kebangsaanensis TaxID=864058 RepID=UPI001F40D3FF|nr:hypothetical protein [Streptomyces kebangsaanensis]
MVLILLVLLVTAPVLGWFGIEDLGEALTYTGRVTGAVLVLVSATVLLGAAAVVDHWFRNSFPYSGMVALIGVVAALLANATLLLETFKDGDSTAYLVLWSLLTAGSAWAVSAVWRTSVVIPAPKRVAAALIVSSSLAVANFGYQYLFQPYQHGAKPLVTMTVGKPVLSQDRKAFAVAVDIRLENRSDVGFYLLGTEFHAMGERVPLSTKDRLRKQWRADAKQWGIFHDKHPLSRREINQPGELVAAQPWMPVGDWTEAGDVSVTRILVQLPVNTPYDQLAFYATASFARKDRLGLDQLESKGYSWSGGKVPQWLRNNKTPSDFVIYRGRAYENNAIATHTMDPRYVTVYWKFGTNGAGLVEVIARSGEEDRELSEAESRAVRSRYGLVDVETGPIEQTLWNVKSRR